MRQAAQNLEFEEAAAIRDQIKRAEKMMLEMPSTDPVVAKITPKGKPAKKKR